MFRNLFQSYSADVLVRRRSLIQALFGDKPEDPTEEFVPDNEVEWTWDTTVRNEFVDFLNNNRDVKFHKNFSSGTAVVRGSQPMMHDQYFWEVKMISPVYGTDMMIGVGTPEADLSQVHEKFVSLLGLDKQTWGLSYTGLFHHNGIPKGYSKRFGQGSIIGVHLDLWNGTLAFYKNGKHLGVASRGLKGKTFYAMASSTAACSGMRIVRSSSFPSSLQFLCCSKLRKIIPEGKSVLEELNFPPGLRVFLENRLDWLLYPCSTQNHCTEQQQKVKNTQDSNPSQFPQTLQETSPLRDVTTVRLGNRYYFFSRYGAPSDVREGHSSRYEGSVRAIDEQVSSADENSNSAEEHCLCEFEVEERSEVQSYSADENTNSAEEHCIGAFEVEEEEDNREESAAKRRKCSYNYIMGLSDPDSD